MDSTSPVSDDTATLMFPEAKKDFDICDNRTDCIQHALPDARQISQVKYVVEFGWSWQHLDLDGREGYPNTIIKET